jgi:hypothetical protein
VSDTFEITTIDLPSGHEKNHAVTKTDYWLEICMKFFAYFMVMAANSGREDYIVFWNMN